MMTPDPNVVTPLLQYGALGLVGLGMAMVFALLWKLTDKLGTRFVALEDRVDKAKDDIMGEVGNLRIEVLRERTYR